MNRELTVNRHQGITTFRVTTDEWICTIYDNGKNPSMNIVFFLPGQVTCRESLTCIDRENGIFKLIFREFDSKATQVQMGLRRRDFPMNCLVRMA